MALGSIVPGSFVTMSPDAVGSWPASYASLPSPTMEVKAEHLNEAALFLFSLADDLEQRKVNLDDLADQDGATGHGGDLVGIPQTVGTEFTQPAGTLNETADWYANHLVIASSLCSPQAFTPGTTGGDLMVGVASYSGTKFTIANGSLRTFIRLVADKAARVDTANTFTQTQTFAGRTTLQGVINEQNGSYRVPDAVNVSATATTLTMDVTTSAYYFADGWTGSGPGPTYTLTVTLADYGGTGEPVMELIFVAGAGGYVLDIKRSSSPPSLITLTAGAITNATGASLRFKWSQTHGAWRFAGGGPFSSNPAEITALSP